MTLKITPRPKMDSLTKGEEIAFTLDLTDELDGNTVNIYTFKVYDSLGDDVTADFGGGQTIADGVITFGIIAHDTGSYTIEFWITCNEVLPDSVTPYEFFVSMSFIVID
ncbi:hypothetical protein KAU11_00180 [Candidatus Babeliales bacterium]|nr:hypothetical protein [Candidatus Babeliales bacterium]